MSNCHDDNNWVSVPEKKKKSKKRQNNAEGHEEPMWTAHIASTFVIPSTPAKQLRRNRFILMLVGLPGSGKSTFAEKLQQLLPHRFIRISQDDESNSAAFNNSGSTPTPEETQVDSDIFEEQSQEMKEQDNAHAATILNPRERCLATAKQILQDERSRTCLIIDRCNQNRAQRLHWINLAKNDTGESSGDCFPIDCLWFDIPEGVCVKRCQRRLNHPTVPPSQAEKIVSRMAREFQSPLSDQNQHNYYRKLIRISDEQSAKEAFLSYLIE